jgi:predicted lipoprotein with Yx(FWY)xxD motif
MLQESFTLDGVHFRQAYRKCRHRCPVCVAGPGHGPYWYAVQRVDGRQKWTYVGRQLPPGVEVARGH